MLNKFSDVSRLPISEIIIKADVNIRELDPDYVSELMQAQLEYGEGVWQSQWKEKPKINQEGILFSGFHTVTAAQRNFGNDHEIYFQVVEGDSYLLAAGENATHGKRRTNADKRAAVLRWLEDDEGRQWTDRYIAEQCHVSDFLVNSADVSLQENGSDTYDRPTKRKYIDKHGNISWMETAKINEPDEPDADQAELDLEMPSKEVLAYLKQFQYGSRATLTQFADTLSMDCEIVNYSGFSKWGEGYIGQKINVLNTESIDVQEALVKFVLGEFHTAHDGSDKDYWEEAYLVIGDVPEIYFENSIAGLQKLTDLTEDYFKKSDPMYRVIVLLDTVLIARKDLVELLKDFVSLDGEMLIESIPAYEVWIKDYNFQHLLDANDMLSDTLTEIQLVVDRLATFRKSKERELFDAFEGCKNGYVNKRMREYFRDERTD